MRWKPGEGDYTVETVAKEARGTDVVLHLRPDEDDLLFKCAAADDPAEGLRSHHAVHPDAGDTWDAAAKTSLPDRAGRASQPGVGPLGAIEAGDHRGRVATSSTSTSRTTSSRRWLTSMRRWKGALESTELF